MRRVGWISAAAAVLTLVAACSGSASPHAALSPSPSEVASPSASGSVSPAAAEDDPPPEGAAVVTADAINLTAADLGAAYRATPGNTASSTMGETESLEDSFGGQCLGLAASVHPATAIVDRESDHFSRGSAPNVTELYSDVAVYPDADDLQKTLVAFRSNSLCLQEHLLQQFPVGTAADGQVTFGKPTAQRLRLSGDRAAFGLAVEDSIHAQGRTIAFRTELRGLVIKHCLVMLFVVAIGDAPPVPSDTLFRLVERRTRDSAV